MKAENASALYAPQDHNRTTEDLLIQSHGILLNLQQCAALLNRKSAESLRVALSGNTVNSTRKLIQFSARQHFKTDTAPSFFHAGRGQLRHRPYALAGKVVTAHQSSLALPL